MKRLRVSQFVLGRRPIRERINEKGEVTVAAVQCNRFSEDPWVMFVETTKKGKQKFPVLYRINVKLKNRICE